MKKGIKEYFSGLEDKKLISVYGIWIDELKNRKRAVTVNQFSLTFWTAPFMSYSYYR